MHDVVKICFENVYDHIHCIESWFAKINDANDFISNEEGDILLNAISMRLLAVGEN